MKRSIEFFLGGTWTVAMATLGLHACGPTADPAAQPSGTGATGGDGGGSSGTGATVIITDAGPVDECDQDPPPPGCLVAARAACGDGNLDSDPCTPEQMVGNGCQEECDDGNSLPGDGCSGTCRVELYSVCPVPGQPCESTIVCGDSQRHPGEMCDDGNTTGGDGCSADCSMVEPGFACRTPGSACEFLELCGDGRVTGSEFCDDGNTERYDGCSPTCQWEDGFACSASEGDLGCVPDECGNGVVGNAESCDDGNLNPGDGCSSHCEWEPNCTAGPCTTVCGDGLLLPGGTEVCDDGNARDGDGCSVNCELEEGFTCSQPPLGDTMSVPVLYRDFTDEHPNFEPENDDTDEITPGIVADTLGPDGLPQFTGQGLEEYLTNAADFATWFSDSDWSIAIPETLNLTREGENFVYEAPAFFPIDQRGWSALGQESSHLAEIPPPYDESWGDAGQHYFYFTSEVRFWFEYTGSASLEFLGDDDVWVFINGHLAVDVGGIHSPMSGSVDVATRAADFGLVEGNVYEIVVFQAERHITCSSYKLTLSGFNTAPTDCVSNCGDGIVAAGSELCDYGVPPIVCTGPGGACNDDAGYNGCRTDCTFGPYCGDGFVQDQFEQCDHGVDANTGEYGGCNPDCTIGPYCGDGVVQAPNEQCDDGVNDGGYAECQVGCVIGPYCGDGHIDAPAEDCDDGNNVDHDGCSAACASEIRVE